MKPTTSNRAALALLLLVACSRVDVENRFLASPLPEGTRAAILAVTSGGSLTVEAFDVDAAEPLLPGATFEEDASLELLGFTRSLDTLGLEPGELGALEDGTALPSPATVHRATLERSDWVPADAPSDRVAMFRTGRTETDPCAKLDVRTLFLDTVAPATSVVPVGDALWIFTEVPGEVFVFDGTTTQRTLTSPVVDTREVGVGPDGRLAVFTYRELYRGRPDGLELDLVVETSSIGRGVVSRVFVTDDRVLLITTAGRVVEAGSTSSIFEFDLATTSDDTGIIEVDGVIYAVSENTTRMVRVPANGPARLIGVPSSSGPLSIAHLEDYGVVVGTVSSEVYRVVDDRLDLIGIVGLNKSRTVLPWGDDILVGGNNGSVAILARDGTTCTTGRETVEDLAIGARLGDAAVFLPTSGSDRVRAGGNTPMTVVRVR